MVNSLHISVVATIVKNVAKERMWLDTTGVVYWTPLSKSIKNVG
jgi:hypothetical protein